MAEGEDGEQKERGRRGRLKMAGQTEGRGGRRGKLAEGRLRAEGGERRVDGGESRREEDIFDNLLARYYNIVKKRNAHEKKERISGKESVYRKLKYIYI